MRIWEIRVYKGNVIHSHAPYILTPPTIHAINPLHSLRTNTNEAPNPPYTMYNFQGIVRWERCHLLLHLGDRKLHELGRASLLGILRDGGVMEVWWRCGGGVVEV